VAALILILGATVAHWDEGVHGVLTVQITPTDDPVRDAARFDHVLAILATTPDVKHYDALDKARLSALLAPWIGDLVHDDAFPIPRLIDVELAPSATLTADTLERQILARVPGISIDDHRLWLDDLIKMIETFEILALMILLFITIATIGTVMIVTRTGLALHHDAIEILHLIGAEDRYIARQFAQRAFGLGLRGGILGALLAALVLWGMAHLAGRLDPRLLPQVDVGGVHLALLVALPVGVALIAMITARITVLRNLSRTF
jgi:cell division transport system permease protein